MVFDLEEKLPFFLSELEKKEEFRPKDFPFFYQHKHLYAVLMLCNFTLIIFTVLKVNTEYKRIAQTIFKHAYTQNSEKNEIF